MLFPICLPPVSVIVLVQVAQVPSLLLDISNVCLPWLDPWSDCAVLAVVGLPVSSTVVLFSMTAAPNVCWLADI